MVGGGLRQLCGRPIREYITRYFREQAWAGLGKASSRVPFDNVEIAFNDEFAAGGWDASKRKEVAKALRSKGKTSKAAIHRARPCASLPPDEKTEASSKASPIEDVQVLVGNTEHDNVWKDYCALTASVGHTYRNFLYAIWFHLLAHRRC
eukprot:346161-Amorphochlora_amoeboformis.AAC.2